MTRLGDTLHHVAGELRQSGVPFALVGGLAVSVRTEPRFTRDADLAVAVASDEQAETIIRSMLRATVRAHESLRLIDSRGFHRGRDLMTEWRALRGE